MKIQILAASAAVTALSAGAHAAQAATAPASTYTYYFTGDCTDCGTSGHADAHGVLTLNNNSTTISNTNFVSFDYSSGKVGQNTIYNDFPFGGPYVGSLNMLPGYNSTSFAGKTIIDGNSFEFNAGDSFESNVNGTWSFDQNNVSADYGTNGVWSANDPSSVSAAPEPESWALLAGGVAAMGLAMRAARRRQRAAVAA